MIVVSEERDKYTQPMHPNGGAVEWLQTITVAAAQY
jgi:hypothetical protein